MISITKNSLQSYEHLKSFTNTSIEHCTLFKYLQITKTLYIKKNPVIESITITIIKNFIIVVIYTLAQNRKIHKIEQ